MLLARPVEERDVPVVCGLPQSAEELFFLYPRAEFPLTPVQLHRAIAERADSTVVERAGEVVAFANFYRAEAAGRCALGNVIVAPSVRGQGVGRFLIGHMIGLAFAKHRASEVLVSCFNRNVAGLLLYATLGFQPFAVEERRTGNGERVALLHLRLPRSATGVGKNESG